MFLFISGNVNSKYQIRVNIPGSRWSNRIYMQQSNLNFSQCQSLCFLTGTITCHFYLFLNGICYLGNILNNYSILGGRIDIQNINIFQGNEKMLLASFLCFQCYSHRWLTQISPSNLLKQGRAAIYSFEWFRGHLFKF